MGSNIFKKSMAIGGEISIMIKLYLTVFLISYLATAFCRYGIGTTHDERMQTQFKLLKLNKPLHFLLFL
ncbi:MAG: hypothetical protein ACI4RB_05750, partial [Acutalibacteraceae bacterium]